MAIFQVNFFANTMKRPVCFNALIPNDKYEAPDQEVKEKPSGPMKSIYLLHGYSGNHMDWLTFTKIQEVSLKYNIAVFMPSGENSFYLDDEDVGAYYGELIGNELIDYTRKTFHLSDKREDTFIGGLSMGGYGAIRNGLKYSDRFGRIIALSSALITNQIAGITPDFKGPVADYPYYRRVFGDLDQLLGSDKDPEALIRDLKQRKADIPKIYMACGTEDFLIKENRSLHEFLVSENVEHTYVEDVGVHDWAFWNEYIDKGMAWATE